MTTFLNSLATQGNRTLTENGAATNRSSLDPIVDFFGLAGAMRETPNMAADLFEAAYRVDPQTAVRTLFYLRDVRGGQGERDVFRACLTRLAEIDREGHYGVVVPHIPTYGRWDDLFHAGLSTPGLQLIQRQLNQDLVYLRTGESVSLLAKWLPSVNGVAPATRSRGVAVAEYLGLSEREYRTTLASLRGKIRLLETDMSQHNWDGIDFGKLPSQAHRKHVKAFKRHLPEHYERYLSDVEQGKDKINVKAVYPYELYNMAGERYADVAWEKLPDYTRGNNAIVMADVSGSMYGLPISVSVSLALYFAERNQGVFNGYFMTFSGAPELVKIKGNTLSQRLASISSRGDWGMNTDLLAAFRAILTAGRTAPQDIPKVLYIISDMEFDAATGGGEVYQYQRNILSGAVRRVTIRPPDQSTIFEHARQEYAAAGLELPHVVFWNVNARQTQAPATILDGNVSLVSGLSPTIFAQAVEGKSPRELVDSVVNGPRYQAIVL